MRSIKEFSNYIDKFVRIFLEARTKSKEEFVKTEPEELYDDIQNSKVGYIKVWKISNNPGIRPGKVYEGFTPMFGENLGVYISSPTSLFRSSTIQEIDWDNNEFHTLNSTYKFEFEELDTTDLPELLSDLKNDR